MAYWSSITIAILIATPLAFSRHIEHSSSTRNSRRHEEANEDNEDSWLFPKSHLRLHSKPPKVLHTKEGGSEMLECQAGGSPLPHLYWLKNGEQISKVDLEDELESNDPEQKLNMGSTSSRLYLDCLTIGDEAEYTCIAENSNLRESTTTRVTVSSSDDRNCHDKKRFGQAPRIVTWTKTVLENQGEDVRASCRSEGDPKPKTKWLDPHDEEIDPARRSKFDILSNGDLLIRNLKWKDMGNYICIAENAHGSARAEIFVYPAALET